jgi:hypothetical protein
MKFLSACTCLLLGIFLSAFPTYCVESYELLISEVKRNNTENVEMMLKNGDVIPDESNNWCSELVQFATVEQYREIIKILSKYGARYLNKNA